MKFHFNAPFITDSFMKNTQELGGLLSEDHFENIVIMLRMIIRSFRKQCYKFINIVDFCLH